MGYPDGLKDVYFVIFCFWKFLHLFISAIKRIVLTIRVDDPKRQENWGQSSLFLDSFELGAFCFLCSKAEPRRHRVATSKPRRHRVATERCHDVPRCQRCHGSACLQLCAANVGQQRCTEKISTLTNFFLKKYITFGKFLFKKMVTGRFAHGQFARGQFAHGLFAHNYCFFVKIYEFMDKLTISTLHYVKIIKIIKVEKRNKQIIWLCNTTQLGFPSRKLEDPWRI